MALSSSRPTWTLEVEESYEQDLVVMKVIPELLVKPPTNQEFTLQDGILRKKRLIYVGSHGDLRKRLLEEAHSSAMGGHSGRKGTLKRLQLFFYWTNIDKDVITKVTECAVCQQSKSEHVKSP